MFERVRGIRGRILYTYLFLTFISMTVVGISILWMLKNYMSVNFQNNFINQAGWVTAGLLLLAGILIATCIAVFLSIKLAKGLTEPIESIILGARKIAAGNLTTRVFAGSQDEIGELGSAINYMTKTLQQHIEEISQEKSRLENILHTMVSGVIMLDNYGFVRIVNPAAEDIFGVSALTAEGKHNLEIIRHNGLNQEIEKCLISEKIIDYEFSLHFPEERVLQCYIAPVYRDTRIAGITMVFHDITKLRKVEQIRADFVANASHELRTPLTPDTASPHPGKEGYHPIGT